VSFRANGFRCRRAIRRRSRALLRTDARIGDVGRNGQCDRQIDATSAPSLRKVAGPGHAPLAMQMG
jgi:hypothetical protein